MKQATDLNKAKILAIEDIVETQFAQMLNHGKVPADARLDARDLELSYELLKESTLEAIRNVQTL